MEIKHSRYQGWETLQLSGGEISLQIAPRIGGRIISMTYGGEELLFLQQEHAGEVFDFSEVTDLRAKKRELGFRLWGGDKTWIAPQESWWEGIPPLEGDAGGYEASQEQDRLILTGPVCRETGIRIRRTLQLTPGGVLHLEQQFTNESRQPVKRGIWDVTQMLRPFTVYVPLPAKSVRGYPTEGDSVQLHKTLIQESEGWSSIPCREPLHFKFGGLLARGELLALRPGEGGALAHLRTFSSDPGGSSAHDATFEVYNSPSYDYLEVEIHAPWKELAPGESMSHSQSWSTAWIAGEKKPKEIVESMRKRAERKG